MKKFAALLLICCLIPGLCACHNSTTYDSLDDYLKTEVSLTYPELSIFPEKEKLNKNAVEFYRSETVRTPLSDDVYFLLRCNYDRQEYEQEIQRIYRLGAKYYEKMFRYPAFVMLFSGLHYEYMLVDSQNLSIIYVYAMASGFHPDASVMMFEDFPEEYLPIGKPSEDIIVYEE